MKAGVHFLGCGHACIKPHGKVFPRYMLGILGMLGSFHPRIFFRSLNKCIVSTTICQGKSKRISHFDPSLFFVQIGQNEYQRTHDAMIAWLWPSQRRRRMVIMTVIIASCVRWEKFWPSPPCFALCSVSGQWKVLGIPIPTPPDVDLLSSVTNQLNGCPHFFVFVSYTFFPKIDCDVQIVCYLCLERQRFQLPIGCGYTRIIYIYVKKALEVINHS